MFKTLDNRDSVVIKLSRLFTPVIKDVGIDTSCLFLSSSIMSASLSVFICISFTLETSKTMLPIIIFLAAVCVLLIIV